MYFAKTLKNIPFWVVKLTIIIVIVSGRAVYIEVGPYKVNEIETIRRSCRGGRYTGGRAFLEEGARRPWIRLCHVYIFFKYALPSTPAIVLWINNIYIFSST